MEGGFDAPNTVEISRTAALQHAEYIISKSGKLKPSMDDFMRYIANDQSAKKKLKQDKEKTEQKQLEFSRKSSTTEEKEVKKISDATEIVMLEIIEKYGSLGDQVHATMTNPHDDFFNHTDAYAEIFKDTEEGEEGDPLVIGFGFDFTTGPNEAIRKIRENIKRIEMNRRERPHLDYFVSSKTEIDEHGQEVPFRVGHMEIVPIVIGLEHRHAKELNFLYFLLSVVSEEKKRLKSGPLYQEKNNEYQKLRAEILRHPIRHMIVQQINWQMGKYRELLDRDNELDRLYWDKIDQLEDVLAGALSGLSAVEKKSDWEKDHIHNRIKEETARSS